MTLWIRTKTAHRTRSRRTAETMRTGARRAQIALYNELERPCVDVQSRSIHAIRKNYPIMAYCRISCGEINCNFVAVSRLDEDDVGKFYTPNSLPGRSANFR